MAFKVQMCKKEKKLKKSLIVLDNLAALAGKCCLGSIARVGRLNTQLDGILIGWRQQHLVVRVDGVVTHHSAGGHKQLDVAVAGPHHAHDVCLHGEHQDEEGHGHQLDEVWVHAVEEVQTRVVLHLPLSGPDMSWREEADDDEASQAEVKYLKAEAGQDIAGHILSHTINEGNHSHNPSQGDGKGHTQVVPVDPGLQRVVVGGRVAKEVLLLMLGRLKKLDAIIQAA